MEPVRSRKIIEFYSAEIPDHRGSYLHDILQWSDDQLECTHDYIQWLFPLPERSAFNIYAPTLDAAMIREFKSRPELRENVRTSFRRMLTFYGLEIGKAPQPVVRKGPRFRERASNWLVTGNHNHLRITRILRCLRLLGLENEAVTLFDCLSSIYAEEQLKSEPAISAETLEYWKRAATGNR